VRILDLKHIDHRRADVHEVFQPGARLAQLRSQLTLAALLLADQPEQQQAGEHHKQLTLQCLNVSRPFGRDGQQVCERIGQPDPGAGQQQVDQADA
jgi:hypothetical protein